MSVTAQVQPELLPIDSHVEERIDHIQQAAFRASASVEIVRRLLQMFPSDKVRGVHSTTFADALECATMELRTVADQLDLSNRRKPV